MPGDDAPSDQADGGTDRVIYNPRSTQPLPEVSEVPRPRSKSRASGTNRKVSREHDDETSPSLELQRRFGVNFREARRKADLLQRDIEVLTNIPYQTVSNIEHGKDNLTIRQMQRLAASVGLDVSDLLKPIKPKPAKK